MVAGMLPAQPSQARRNQDRVLPLTVIERPFRQAHLFLAAGPFDRSPRTERRRSRVQPAVGVYGYFAEPGETNNGEF